VVHDIYSRKNRNVLLLLLIFITKCNKWKDFKESLSEINETALDAAIRDAAGLEDKENTELLVESIQIGSPTNNEQGNPANSSEGENLSTSNSDTTVSTLLVSERTCSGTESVQITEKLIKRESWVLLCNIVYVFVNHKFYNFEMNKLNPIEIRLKKLINSWSFNILWTTFIKS